MTALVEPGVYATGALALVTSLLAAGIALFLVLPGAAPAAVTLRRVVTGLVVTAFAASLLAVAFALIEVDGSLTGLADRLAGNDVLRGGDYEAVLTRAVGLVALALGTQPRVAQRWRRSALVAGAVVVAGSFLLMGHSRTHGPALVVVACGLAHVLGASGWIGGVVGLGVALRSAGREAAGRLVTTFAGLMTGVVTMLLAGGVGLALLYVPSVHALLTTTYGAVLLIKVALVAGVLVLSAANHRRLVPLTAAGHPRARQLLRINVAAEQIVLVAVVLITEVLMRQNPGG